MPESRQPPIGAGTREEFCAALRSAVGLSARAAAEALKRRSEAAAASVEARLKSSPPPPEPTRRRTVITDVFAGRRLPDAGLLDELLQVAGIDDLGRRQWSDVMRGLGTAETSNERVRHADPWLLGVRRVVDAPDAAGELPGYVRRDCDGGPDGLRRHVARASVAGGFLVVLGEPSVGKTRSAYEAVLHVLPEWGLLHPRKDLTDLAGFAADPLPRTVVWLDQLERYLDGGLDADLLRLMLARSAEVVVVATMSSSVYAAARRRPEDGEDDPTWSRREVLQLARATVVVGVTWSEAELRDAEGVAAGDLRVKEALALSRDEFSPPRVMAAAPQLQELWRIVADPSRSVLRAAVDLRRLGHHGALSPALLETAAEALCGGAGRRRATSDWLGRSIEELTAKVGGDTSALVPVPGERIGDVCGYEVAAYLAEYACADRRREPVVAAVWEAAVRYPGGPEDIDRLRVQACRRALRTIERQLLARQLNAGGTSVRRASAVLGRRWRDDAALAELRMHAHLDEVVGERLAAVLGRRACNRDDKALAELAELAKRSDAARIRLLATQAERGAIDVLEVLRHEAPHSPLAAARLAAYWARRARRGSDDAMACLRELADNVPDAEVVLNRLAVVLGRRARQHDNDAVDELRRRADDSVWMAEQWVGALAARGGDAALSTLRDRALRGDQRAASALAERGDEPLDDLASCPHPAVARLATAEMAYRHGVAGSMDAWSALREAAPSDPEAADRLAELLTRRADPRDADELRVLADTGLGSRACAAVTALILRQEHDPVPLLRREVHAGNSRHAADALLTVYAAGNAERLRALERAGLDVDAAPAG